MTDQQADTGVAEIIAGSVVTRAIVHAHDAVAVAWAGSWARAMGPAPGAPVTFWSIVALSAAVVAFAGSRLGAIL